MASSPFGSFIFFEIIRMPAKKKSPFLISQCILFVSCRRLINYHENEVSKENKNYKAKPEQRKQLSPVDRFPREQTLPRG